MGLIGRKEGVEHIDTNIIIRMIAKDNPAQLKRIRKLFSNMKKIFVFEDSAMMEVVYVLSGKIYNFDREQISRDIKNVMLIPNLVCNKGILEDALDLYVTHPKLSFVDCYLTASTNLSGETPLWTLDHKLASQCAVAREL
jgi:predicted nucleic-acid-binding protein